jgi:DNA modification methylase
MGRAIDKGTNDFWTLHQHDARNLEKLLAGHSTERSPLLTATITSPPYGALKDYGHAKQIGFGQTYDRYLDEMASIFSQLHRHTKVDGSLWLVADTYVDKGREPRRLIPLPFDLAAAAGEVGWTLRDVIVWQKDRTLPWSNGTRLRNAFEYVLLLVKGPKPKYRLDELREHKDFKEWWVRFPERYHPDGKAPTNVWNIPIPKQGSWGSGEIAHACPLPPELVRRLVLLSTDENDVVLDPFAGSGVVVAQSEALGRRALGCEIVGRHIREYETIVRPEVQSAAVDAAANGTKKESGQVILDLRALKLARVLMQSAARRRDQVAWPSAALVIRGKRKGQKGQRQQPTIYFAVDGSAERKAAYKASVESVAARPPASKFGLDAQMKVVATSVLGDLVRGHRLFLYTAGRTTRSTKTVKHSELVDIIAAAATDSIPPILSNIHLDIPPRSDSSVLPGQGGKISSR